MKGVSTGHLTRMQIDTCPLGMVTTTPFQCDLCVFRVLQGRNPGPHDALLLACIQQANLDAFWGRESATVSPTLRAVIHTTK